MKIRNGFVSNSSSSSFIIGLAKVQDENKLRTILDKMPDIKNDYFLGNYNDFISSEYKCYEINFSDGRISVEAPINNSFEISLDVNDEEKVFAFCVGNDEGDSEFYDLQKDELNYDKVTEDWFEGDQAKILELFATSHDILKNKIYKIGAARNG